AAGPCRRRSTGTSRRRSSPSPSRPASGRARTTPTAARCWPRCATSSAVMRGRPSRGGRAMAATKGKAPPAEPPAPATAAPAKKDAPRTMRDLRLATENKRRAASSKGLENPLREGLRLERVPDPAAFVLFGATGDLAHRKVVPALFQLWRTHL